MGIHFSFSSSSSDSPLDASRQEKNNEYIRELKKDQIDNYAEDIFTRVYSHPNIARKCYGQWQEDYHCRGLYNMAYSHLLEK